ncbi:MAG: SUMF1/EgtB/PvdO family nonheme iron enzyme [Ignavibacteria bacterium]|nr:SUMF1/EgtB/PvdO family nonheme iron enzyme [Ignavibacteria bacterium]
MLYRKFKILLLFSIFASLLVFKCKDENGLNNTSFGIKPKLYEIKPDSIFPFDVVTIYGENLGLKSDSSFIFVDTFLLIDSKNCIKWNNSFIQFIAPKNFFKGKIFVTIGKDTSNKLTLNYLPYPKIDLVKIPSGVFLMGSKTGLGYEQPVHEVHLTQSFYISKYEITQKQWLTIMDSNPSQFVGEKLPVMNVDWVETLIFCNRLSKLMNLDTCYIFGGEAVYFDTNANGFRLPTEAEWEYACRAGSVGDFAGTGNPLEMGWFDVNSGMKPHPVGEKYPNSWGIYDMHGNAWEWCWDWFDPFYYEKSPRVNPRGPYTGKNRVVRGGCWQKGTTFGRSSSRQFPEDQKTNFGFRVVRNAQR